jgi:GNAT superfamily N-acetyltransferase
MLPERVGGPMMHIEVTDGYAISDDPKRLNVDAIHAYLVRSYWAAGVPREIVARSLEHSLCIGVYTAEGQQVGLARVISDYTTFAYLCDVYILEEHRGRGLSKALMRAVTSHPRLQNLRRFNLLTQDAHGLYRQFGFSVPTKPDRYMEKLDPDVTRRWIEPVQRPE